MKRLRNRHRSGPGAGTPRTWTVSSSVGAHASGTSLRLKHTGANASAACSSPKASMLLLVGRRVGEREPAADLAGPGRPARRGTRHRRGGRGRGRARRSRCSGAGGTVRTQSSNGGRSGGAPSMHDRAAGDLIAERAEHDDHVDVGAQPRDGGGHPAAGAHDVDVDLARPRPARREVVGGDAQRRPADRVGIARAASAIR